MKQSMLPSNNETLFTPGVKNRECGKTDIAFQRQDIFSVESVAIG